MPGELPIEFGTQDAAETYRQRLESATRKMLLLQRRDRRFVRLRTALFIVLIVLGAWLAGDKQATIPCLFTGVILVLIMVAHQQTGIWVWWVFGIGLGIAILSLFALFEKKRPEMLAWVEKIRNWKG